MRWARSYPSFLKFVRNPLDFRFHLQLAMFVTIVNPFPDPGIVSSEYTTETNGVQLSVTSIIGISGVGIPQSNVISVAFVINTGASVSLSHR